MREYDYEIRRGETFEKGFYIETPEGKPVDLTGMHAKGQIRKQKEDPELTAEFRCTIDTTIAFVSFGLSATDTKNIPAGKYEYDVALYEDSTNERVSKYWIGGKFQVLKAVTDVFED